MSVSEHGVNRMERKNLAYGKTVEITNIVPIKNSYASVEKGRKDTLTNGVIGDPSSCYGGDWVHFYRGVGRRLTVDLGAVLALDGFEIGFIHDKKAGIYSPEYVKCYISENGTDYYEAATAKTPFPASFGEQVRAVYASTFKETYRARFVMLEFYVEVNAFCDELRIFGGECIGFESSPNGNLFTDEDKNTYAERGSLCGIHDIPLLYFGYWPEDERVAKLRKDDFIPYIAYVDRDGNPKDVMFDALMFLTVQGRCPSGGCLGYHGEPSYLSDWEFVLNELFADGQNLKAYDEAVAEVKKTLGLPKDYKHKFYLTAPVPKISLNPFGDMNGDGIEEKILSTEDCIEAYAWFVDAATRRFNAEHFENILLDGWFWNNESCSRANRDDEEDFATGCIKELHKRGHKCIFIPYFQAGGCEKAEAVGFDCTTMQPGLSFQSVLANDPQGMFADFTSLCKKYGFGVELEIHHGVKNPETKEKFGELFDQYLLGCVRNGMMIETIHTYYQAAGPGVFHFCANSKDDYQRSIYDKLYKFVKGTLTEEDIIKKAPVSEELPEPEIAATPEPEINAVECECVSAEPEFSAPAEDIGACESYELEEPEDFDENVDITFDVLPKNRKYSLKKLAAIGAGIAAALGIVYIITKALKGKDNE